MNLLKTEVVSAYLLDYRRLSPVASLDARETFPIY